MIVTAALAAATLGLWLVTKAASAKQASDMNASIAIAGTSADVARQALEIVERAYLTVDPRGINPWSTEPAMVGHVTIRNAGRLPARDIRWHAKIKLSAGKEESDFPLDDHWLKGNHVLARGTDMIQGTEKMPNSALEHCRDAEWFIYVWGIVRYTDGFGEDCFTKFCHRYPVMPETIERRVIAREYARFHEHGNDAERPRQQKPPNASI